MTNSQPEFTKKEMYIGGGTLAMITLAVMTGNLNLFLLILFWGAMGIGGFYLVMKIKKHFDDQKKKEEDKNNERKN